MAVNSSPFGPKPQWFTDTGAPCAGYQLFSYVGGSVNTKQDTFTDYTGGVANPNPIVLDINGYVPDGLFFTAGQTYKLVLATPTDTDPPTTPVWTEDGLRGINDTSVTIDQWVAGPQPTFVSGTSFTLVGDQTSIFKEDRRLKIVDAIGTKYATITSSMFAGVTTVNIDNDGAALVSPLSSVAYGLLSSDNVSIPTIIVGGSGITVAYTAGIPTISVSSQSLLPMTNGIIVASVAGSALTVAVKTALGADPSVSDPVFFSFRNTTLATGDYTVVSVTSALSLTVSSGSTLGTTSAVAARLYIAAFNDAGTVRLGIYNPLSTLSLIGLVDDILYSSTAEGGIGGADSAQVIYTGTGVTTKALRVIGYLEATEATAGTWATAPSKLQLIYPGVKRTGDVVQQPRADDGSVITGTGVIPGDDTIPQITEGTQFITATITPISALNLLRVTCQVVGSNNAASGFFAAALFQDAIANALKTTMFTLAGAGGVNQENIIYEAIASTLSTITYRIRMGCSAASTSTFNGQTGTRFYGGTMNSYIQIEEIMV